MKLYDIITTIQRLALIDPTVGDCFEGDIYESLNANQDVKYPAVVITQNSHIGNLTDENTTFNFNIFAVDRQTEDGQNKLQVQSWAVDVLNTLLIRIEEENLGIVNDNFEIKTFAERFESICAGAFVTVSIVVQNDNECCVCIPE